MGTTKSGITKLQIGGIVAALCVFMFIVALGVDQLFVGVDEGKKGICGWEQMKGMQAIGGRSIKVKVKWDDRVWGQAFKDQKIAGQVWLAFGILTVLIGAAGSVTALVPQLAKFKKVAICCCVVAGIFGIIASAVPFSGECADSKEMKPGASVIMGLVFAIGFFVAAIPMKLK